MASPNERVGATVTSADGHVASVHEASAERGMLWTYRAQTMLSDIPAGDIGKWLTARMAEMDVAAEAEALVGIDLLAEEV